jgi:hypothetical protein
LRFKLWKTRRVKNQRFESKRQLWKTAPESASFLPDLFPSLRGGQRPTWQSRDAIQNWIASPPPSDGWLLKSKESGVRPVGARNDGAFYSSWSAKADHPRVSFRGLKQKLVDARAKPEHDAV